jgi:hypothetical protein
VPPETLVVPEDVVAVDEELPEPQAASSVAAAAVEAIAAAMRRTFLDTIFSLEPPVKAVTQQK